MKKFERKNYFVTLNDATGKKISGFCEITDQGSKKDNEKYIKSHLKEKNATNITIDETKKGTMIEHYNNESVEDVGRAIDIAKKMPVGFLSSKLSKKDKKAIGPYMMEQLSDPLFIIVCIFDRCYGGKIFRDIETERLRIASLYHHGGHIMSDFFNDYLGLFDEHTKCLSDNDVKRLMKEKEIYKYEIQIKTNPEISDLMKKLISMEISISKKRQKNIDEILK